MAQQWNGASAASLSKLFAQILREIDPRRLRPEKSVFCDTLISKIFVKSFTRNPRRIVALCKYFVKSTLVNSEAFRSRNISWKRWFYGSNLHKHERRPLGAIFLQVLAFIPAPLFNLLSNRFSSNRSRNFSTRNGCHCTRDSGQWNISWIQSRQIRFTLFSMKYLDF